MAYHLLLVEIVVVINQQDTPYRLFCPYTRNDYNSFFLIGYDRQWILKPTTDLKEISSNLLTGRTKITVKKDSILALNTEYWSKHEYSKKITLKEVRSLINQYGSLGVLFAPQEVDTGEL